MPGEVIDRPNPQPLPSHVPDYVEQLLVKLDKPTLDENDNKALAKYRRAANYIAAAMIFLGDNTLVKRDLTFDDIKPRLLGHWGTCPGLTLVYSHLNVLIKKYDLDMVYVVGPGHGAPSILANLWMEGSLGKYYPEYARNTTGLHNLISGFSTAGGLPSHINAETPGAIHEGGELGYALSVSFGAIMDNPDLIVTCVVGDGEAETGPTATAWHGYKYIDPAESGAVLPIIHVNGFKISERTIYGCMDDREMAALFTGYGYQPRVVDDLNDIDADLSNSMEWALGEIRKIQKAARSGNPILKPRWPVLIMRTPKGWSGPKIVHNEFVEGSFRAHQVPLAAAKKDPGELKDLQSWLKSYQPEELFTEDGDVVDDIKALIPDRDDKKLGQSKVVNQEYIPIKPLDWKPLSVKKGVQASCMHTVGLLLKKVVEDNPKSFRIFSPDEFMSNKLDPVLDITGRNFQWDEFSNARGGRLIEVLSEHQCQGFMQGYTLTGRTALFPSYEAFLGIVHTMMVQYAKFGKMAKQLSWRGDVASINYLETSTWTRQEHNGFSHQNPSFIGAVMNLKPDAARVYLPPDANTFISTMAHCLQSKNYVNLMVGSKQPSAAYLSADEAEDHCRAGGSIWKFASTDEGLNPDVVLVGIGAELTFEVIAAAELLKKLAPELRLRVINVTDLMILGYQSSHPHSLTDQAFDALFTEHKPIHFNYHGYANELRGLLFGRPNMHRVGITSYKEEGTTTTPFDMMLVNETSRFDIAKKAILGGSLTNEKVKVRLQELVSFLDHQMKEVKKEILATKKDPAFLEDVGVFSQDSSSLAEG
ncbi:putative d-xylulose 5-phosphate d-fructose 6-phosphate [Phaeomoniella chlamydospora]|uniref:Putative d-xylulose 5-phosphate d-fructose 6-phosphate n=1 Tax=Phaeomoniella chlamydospora TaxID=158046 RepID=A0A0G2EM88_PHACM|nr:putative d-xylulose 5-phosphate d-fructose 6-phosphate [Phaeomoniella chlamydospora]